MRTKIFLRSQNFFRTGPLGAWAPGFGNTRRGPAPGRAGPGPPGIFSDRPAGGPAPGAVGLHRNHRARAWRRTQII